MFVAMLEQHAHGTETASDRLRQLSIAYVRFALLHPVHFDLMFSWKARDFANFPGLYASSEAAFGVLRKAIAQGQAEGTIRPGGVDELALAAWSMQHGLSKLVVNQLERAEAKLATPEILSSLMNHFLLTGIGMRPSSNGKT